jgi:molybdate transport system substrate-binding protein
MRSWVAVTGLSALVLAGCAPGSASGRADASSRPPVPAASSSSGDVVSGDVVVFAAASLTEAFTRIGDRFEEAHPDARVTFSFAASSALAQQVVAGAPAGVFAAASPATMSVVTDDGGADGEPQVFARNRLQIVVPAGNPGDVSGLADLADPGLAIALCAEQVPCGAAATAVLAAAGVVPAPDTLEQDVKAVLSKVVLGEVDAGLVYRTDVLAAGDDVEGIAFPEADDAVTDYPVVALDGATEPAVAHAFVAYVLSADGQQVLAEAGFDAP